MTHTLAICFYFEWTVMKAAILGHKLKVKGSFHNTKSENSLSTGLWDKSLKTQGSWFYSRWWKVGLLCNSIIRVCVILPAFCLAACCVWESAVCSSDFSDTRIPIVWIWTCKGDSKTCSNDTSVCVLVNLISVRLWACGNICINSFRVYFRRVHVVQMHFI